MSTDYLKKILTSRVYDIAEETPLELATTLSQRVAAAEVWFTACSGAVSLC